MSRAKPAAPSVLDDLFTDPDERRLAPKDHARDAAREKARAAVAPLTVADELFGADAPPWRDVDAQEAEEAAARLLRQHEIERQQRELERRRARLEGKITELREEFAAQEAETQALIAREQAREAVLNQGRATMALIRQADEPPETDTWEHDTPSSGGAHGPVTP